MRIQNLITFLILIPMFSVYAQKGLTIDLNLETAPIENGAINQTGIGIQYIKDIGTKYKLNNTLEYKNTAVTNEIENYLSKTYVSFNNSTRFNSFAYTFGFTHQITEKTKWSFEIEPMANYENNFDFSEVIVLGGIEVSQMLNKKSSISLGVKRMTVFRKPEILPTFSYNYQINKETYLKLGFPTTELSYSNSIRNKFSLTNDFRGSSYYLNSPIITEDSSSITKLGFSQMETALQYERNLESSWFINLKGGYSSNKEFKFSDKNYTKELNQTLRNGGIFSVSIKYKL